MEAPQGDRRGKIIEDTKYPLKGCNQVSLVYKTELIREVGQTGLPVKGKKDPGVRESRM